MTVAVHFVAGSVEVGVCVGIPGLLHPHDIASTVRANEIKNASLPRNISPFGFLYCCKDDIYKHNENSSLNCRLMD